MKRQDIEIMSPVGSYEALFAAIQGGADSVYFGVEQLNMRAKSSNNFTLDDLRKIVAIGKENKVKTYLTVNTVLYDENLPVMRQILDVAKECGVSAIIASDQAVLNYASQIGVEIHISTQLNVSNIEAVKFYARFSDVIVLARELSLEQIQAITEAIEKEQIRGISGDLIRIELFAHGALCMAISGKCYLSLHEANVSANRGACRQTCRKGYVVTEKETGYELEIDNEYIMSPKDLCTIGFLDRIIQAGVRVLKIEGRARSAEYVKITARCYNEALNAILDGSYGQEKVDTWTKQLSTVFNRGFWNGYYLGKKTGEWSGSYGSKATKVKQYVGKVTNYFSKLGVAEILIEADTLKVGEEILILGTTTGVVEANVLEIRLNLGAVQEAQKGEVISIPIEKIRRGDKLYKLITRMV